ncbi:HIRAN domain-containing protein [Gallaecimonas sp. GXIMD4217]|uniref:HIRAN domain-containing protein n=1 Tax=Gallaecimonas sp. GXIMD4217 TaxID=3131927 RepID=UPI00311AEF20
MKKDYHLADQPIPDGFQIYEERLDVAGISNYKKAASKFIRGNSPSLLLAREPTNKYDKNAIMIIGCYKGFMRTKKVHIGYVPKSVAKLMCEFGFQAFQPRLLKRYEGKSGFVEVLFQLLGPAGRKKLYESS